MGMQFTTFMIFLFPVLSTLLFGTFVISEVLELPDREINMWQFNSNSNNISGDDIVIVGLHDEYIKSSSIEINVLVTDPFFDCGDLFITIYHIDYTNKKIITQNAFFGQCFEQTGSMLPINDKFIDQISDSGNYEMVIEMNDKHYKKTLISNKEFIVQ